MEARANGADIDVWNSVGPVLIAGSLTSAVIAAIQEENPNVRVTDRGAYLRVLVPARCAVSRDAVERRTGQPFRLPIDLEAIMPSFKGELAMDDEGVVWSLGRRATQ